MFEFWWSAGDFRGPHSFGSRAPGTPSCSQQPLLFGGLIARTVALRTLIRSTVMAMMRILMVGITVMEMLVDCCTSWWPVGSIIIICNLYTSQVCSWQIQCSYNYHGSEVLIIGYDHPMVLTVFHDNGSIWIDNDYHMITIINHG